MLGTLLVASLPLTSFAQPVAEPATNAQKAGAAKPAAKPAQKRVHKAKKAPAAAHKNSEQSDTRAPAEPFKTAAPVPPIPPLPAIAPAPAIVVTEAKAENKSPAVKSALPDTRIEPLAPAVAAARPAIATPAWFAQTKPAHTWTPRPNPYLPQKDPGALPIVPPGVTLNSPLAGWKPTIPAAAPAAVPTVAMASAAEPPTFKDSSGERSFLPTIKKVYPTGEKPLVVITFHCPTEAAGINTPITKILHDVVDLLLSGVNATDLLSFNLQQVCN